MDVGYKIFNGITEQFGDAKNDQNDQYDAYDSEMANLRKYLASKPAPKNCRFSSILPNKSSFVIL